MLRESGPDELIVSIENIAAETKRSLGLNPNVLLSCSGPLKKHTTVCTESIAPATKTSLGLNAFKVTDFSRAFTSLPFAPFITYVSQSILIQLHYYFFIEGTYLTWLFSSSVSGC